MQEKRPQAVREQIAKVMRRAQSILGSREALAKHLGVEPHLIGEWIACISDAPDDKVDKAVELIVEGPGGRSAH